MRVCAWPSSCAHPDPISPQPTLFEAPNATQTPCRFDLPTHPQDCMHGRRWHGGLRDRGKREEFQHLEPAFSQRTSPCTWFPFCCLPARGCEAQCISRGRTGARPRATAPLRMAAAVTAAATAAAPTAVAAPAEATPREAEDDAPLLDETVQLEPGVRAAIAQVRGTCLASTSTCSVSRTALHSHRILHLSHTVSLTPSHWHRLTGASQLSHRLIPSHSDCHTHTHRSTHRPVV